MKKVVKNDKNYLQAINMTMQVVIAFFDVFFSIYILEMSNNLSFVFGYLMFQCAAVMLCEQIVLRIINHKNHLLIYRLSFVFILLSIALIFTISANTLFMVYVVQFVYAVAIICYYLPHEISIMTKNNHKTMNNFVGLHQVLTLVAGIISPFISGFVIDYVSYPVLFAFIIVLSAICFGLSFKVDGGYGEIPKLSFGEFFKQAHKYKHVKNSYISHAIFKASQASVVQILLPILIFMKFSSNFSVGLYSALATALSGVVLILCTKFYKKRTIYIYVATAVAVVSSIVVVFFSSLTLFFIYYFCANIAIKLLTKYDAEMVYVIIDESDVSPFKKQHHAVFNVYDMASKILAYGLALLIYTFSKTEVALSIIICSLTLLQIISSILMVKANNDFDKFVAEKEAKQTAGADNPSASWGRDWKKIRDWKKTIYNYFHYLQITSAYDIIYL